MSYSVIDGLVYDLERCYLLLFNRVAYFSILFAVHSHILLSFIASGHDSWLETIASYRRCCSHSAVPSFTGLQCHTDSGLAAAVSGVSRMARLVSESGAAAPEEVV